MITRPLNNSRQIPGYPLLIQHGRIITRPISSTFTRRLRTAEEGGIPTARTNGPEWPSLSIFYIMEHPPFPPSRRIKKI